MPKRKGKYLSPSTSGGSGRRQRVRLTTAQDDHYREVERRLGRPHRSIGYGALEGARQATRRFNDTIAADVLSGMAANAISVSTGIPPAATSIGVALARRALFAGGQGSVSTQNKIMGGIKAAKNMMVNRSSMSVSGKTKVKRVRKVKLSTKFVKGVKQVMEGVAAKGVYLTVKQGMVGSIVSPAPGAITVVDLGTVAQDAILTPSASTSSGNRTLFNCLSQWSTSSAPTGVVNTGLNFFTPAKILDAASVLFNGKALDNPYITTGNLSTTSVGGTGAPVVATPGQLKINVTYCAADFEIKNVSNRVVTMEIWECTPTLKFQLSNPLNVIASHCATYMNTANNNNILYFANTPAATTPFFYHEQSVDPLVVLKRYTGVPMQWKKRTMVLAPDETCIHTIVGPKGVLDFSKLSNTTASAPLGTAAPNLNCLLKGWSVGCVISINGDQVLQPTLAGARGDKAAYADNVNNRMGMPVAVQVREVYKISVPEIAGYITQNGAAGSVQQLNLRKPKFVLWNQVPNNGITSTALIQVSSEENPTAETTTAQQT